MWRCQLSIYKLRIGLVFLMPYSVKPRDFHLTAGSHSTNYFLNKKAQIVLCNSTTSQSCIHIWWPWWFVFSVCGILKVQKWRRIAVSSHTFFSNKCKWTNTAVVAQGKETFCKRLLTFHFAILSPIFVIWGETFLCSGIIWLKNLLHAQLLETIISKV